MRLHPAADELEASAADLIFDVGRSAFAVAGDPDAAVPLARLAEHERLFVRAVFTAPGATFPFGAHVAVVEVDRDTGEIKLIKYVSLADVGQAIHPVLCEGQDEGGVMNVNGEDLAVEVLIDPVRIAGVSLAGEPGSHVRDDVVFAEGQRRYVESLSTYAKQFLERMPKPLVDRLEGLAPGAYEARVWHPRLRGDTDKTGKPLPLVAGALLRSPL